MKAGSPRRISFSRRSSRHSKAGEALIALAVKVDRLNGRLLDAAERLASGHGLSAARWPVLEAALQQPATVAGIARSLGLTRQSVQRLADALAGAGLCEYRDNPAHRRAKLLATTARGRAAIAGIGPVQARWASRVAASVGEEPLRAASAAADALLAALAKAERPVATGARRGRREALSSKASRPSHASYRMSPAPSAS